MVLRTASKRGHGMGMFVIVIMRVVVRVVVRMAAVVMMVVAIPVVMGIILPGQGLPTYTGSALGTAANGTHISRPPVP
jgi:hypothetical protein